MSRSTSGISEIDLILEDEVAELSEIARRMIDAGYLHEYIQFYVSIRKPAVDSSFRRLGIEELSIDDVQRHDWVALEEKIPLWIHAAKVGVRVFANEKRLYEQVFDGVGAAEIYDTCFMETVKGPAIQLFNFAEAISISGRSPEKLFKILDLHDALRDLLPDIESIFDSKSPDSVGVQAVQILSRLAEAARGILSEFRNVVLREASRIHVAEERILPLTRYVMNYISLISDYKQTQMDLILSKPSRNSVDSNTPEIDFTELDNKSPLAVYLVSIIEILQFNLDGEAKHYRDASISHLFIMNNLHYIVQKTKGSPELCQMIGDNYLRKLTGKFREAAFYYQRAAWVEVLYCLRAEGLGLDGRIRSGVSKSPLKERLKSFNALFKDIHRVQTQWLVPDSQLRDEVRISIILILLPAYKSFLERFTSHIKSWKHSEYYIKYSVEDLETAVLDLFEGKSRKTASRQLRKRSQ